MTRATVPLLHRFLGIGLVVVATVFLVLTYLGTTPLQPPDSVTPVMAYTFAGLGFVLVAAAFIVFKPRVPERRPGQSVEEYWTTPEVVARVLPVWFLMEGAGIMAAVGYLVTGATVSAIAMGVAIVAFWLCGPNVFAKP